MASKNLLIVSCLLLAVLILRPTIGQTTSGSSLRFYGSGVNDIDRVKIRIDGAGSPANIGAGSFFTIEFWMKALPGENNAAACSGGDTQWINGNVIIDRDIFGPGDYGDFGISLRGGRVVFGVSRGGTEVNICGTSNLADGAWHHVAATRRSSDGALGIYVDGTLEASGTGPTGNISYRSGRSTSYPNSDPYLVLAAEKHDFGPQYPSFSGWIDELRLSTIRRYTANFTPPSAPFNPDSFTAALYHFDEGQGTIAGDTSTASGGPSDGVLRVGRRGNGPTGPVWSSDTPWGNLSPTNTPTATPAGTPTATLDPNLPTATPTATPTPTATLDPSIPTATPTTTPTGGPTAPPVFLPLLSDLEPD